MGCPGHECNHVEGKSVDIWNLKSMDGNAMNSYQSDILEQLHYSLCLSCPDTKVGITDLQRLLGSNPEEIKTYRTPLLSYMLHGLPVPGRNLFSPPYYFQDGTV